MNDRDFLIWIHERLEHVHKENPLMDYMHKLRAVILSIPENQKSMPGVFNGIDDVKIYIKFKGVS